MSNPTATRRWTPAPHLRELARAPWLLALLAAAALLITLTALSGQSGWGILTANAHTASFVAIVALGQMIVITSGDGAIDLSIPSGVTLSVYVATLLQQGQDGRLGIAAAAAIGLGALVGAVNAVLVTVLRIPAIVATLAVGFAIDSIVNLLSNIPGRGQASPLLKQIATGTIAGTGVPGVALVAVGIGVVVALFLWRTTPGLSIIATGQNAAAAAAARLRPVRSRVIAFVLSGTLTAVAGVLICGYSNGAFLGIGSTYLIASIAAVVLGGTLIAGGMPTAVGCFLGALFLGLLITLTNVLAVPIGIRWLVQGLVIIAALAIPSRRAT
jgi:ribose transport system permease protein